MNAPIVEIKRFAVHDGDGIRTTVFLKGCPLKCVWCHNPESIERKPALAFYRDKCIFCGACVSACPVGAHRLSAEGHAFDRTLCTRCGACEKVCLSDALKFYGRGMTPEALLPLLLEDRDFYETSGGGVTILGGECLTHPEFCSELLRLLKAEGISTAVDTCGFVSRAGLDAVLPYTDVFFYDMKAFDEATHIRCTGQSNRVILDNLRYLDEKGAQIEIRIPFVPGYNTEEIAPIGAFLSTLSHVTKIRVLPYHNYAGSKYAALDMENTLPPTLPTDKEVEAARTLLRGMGLTVTE
ncbi:MAG: glycyl-radical enzyme activating protein [Clostridia bacterium]|nr:glycyl-radical enzyme activating protein [Clostridia bacterium]